VYRQPANALLDAAYAKAFASEVFGDMPLVVLNHSIDEPDEAYARNAQLQKSARARADGSAVDAWRASRHSRYSSQHRRSSSLSRSSMRLKDVLQAASN
jgi:hypothetical protein